MKTNRLLLTFVITLLVLGLGSTAMFALAQEAASRGVDAEHITPNSTLGAAATATDVWSLQCGIGTNRAQADVLDLGGVDGRRFTVTLVDSHGRATSVTGPDGGLSALIQLAAGPGNYLVMISKSAGGTVETYNSIVHCVTAAGGAVAHNILLVQNQ